MAKAISGIKSYRVGYRSNKTKEKEAKEAGKRSLTPAQVAAIKAKYGENYRRGIGRKGIAAVYKKGSMNAAGSKRTKEEDKALKEKIGRVKTPRIKANTRAGRGATKGAATRKKKRH